MGGGTEGKGMGEWVGGGGGHGGGVGLLLTYRGHLYKSISSKTIGIVGWGHWCPIQFALRNLDFIAGSVFVRGAHARALSSPHGADC